MADVMVECNDLAEAIRQEKKRSINRNAQRRFRAKNKQVNIAAEAASLSQQQLLTSPSVEQRSQSNKHSTSTPGRSVALDDFAKPAPDGGFAFLEHSGFAAGICERPPTFNSMHPSSAQSAEHRERCASFGTTPAAWDNDPSHWFISDFSPKTAGKRDAEFGDMSSLAPTNCIRSSDENFGGLVAPEWSTADDNSIAYPPSTPATSSSPVVQHQRKPTLSYGNSLLHTAAAKGLTNIIELLLAAGADVEAVNADRATPLHLAARAGHEGAVRALTRGGSILDALDSRNYTPIHLAVGSGHHTVVGLLIRRGADLSIPSVDS